MRLAMGQTLIFFNRIFTTQNAAVTNPTQAKCHRAQDPVLALYKTSANGHVTNPRRKAITLVRCPRQKQSQQSQQSEQSKQSKPFTKSEQSKQSALSTVQDSSACANRAGDALCAFWLRAADVYLVFGFSELSLC